MKNKVSKTIAATLLAGLAVPLVSAAPAVATVHAAAASAQPAVAKAETAGWKKTLLNKQEVIELSGIRADMIDLGKTYSDKSTYAKTWVGERPGSGMSAAVVQLSKMPSKGWKKSAKGYAEAYGYKVDSLNGSVMKGSKDAASGMRTYAVLRNAGDYVVVIEFSVPGASDVPSESYDVAENLAEAQKDKLNAAGFGK